MSTRNYRTFFLVLGLTIAARIAMFLGTGYSADDAFITYRYAENLAGGHGFEYNPGESVQGTSTPLFTVILAGFSLVFGPQSIPWASRVIGVVADACTVLLVLEVTDPLGSAAQLLAASLFALFPRLVFCFSLGMESPLVVLLMIASWVLQNKGKIPAACGALGVLFLLRVDTILWSALVLGMIVWERKRISIRALVAFFLPVSIWVLFAIATFGSPVPHAVEAKAVSWHHLFGAFEPERVLVGYFPFHGLHDVPPLVRGILCAILVFPAIVILPSLYCRRDPKIIFPFFFLLYNGVFAAARVVMADWYYPPAWIAYAVSLSIAWSWLFARNGVGNVRESIERILTRTLIPVLVLLLAAGIYRWRKDPGEWFQGELVRVGTWLAANARPGSGVLLEPIGVTGWLSKLYVHDEIGLVSPRVIEYRRRFEGSDAWFLDYIEDTKPTYIVLRSRELEENQLFLGHGDGIFRSVQDREWFFSHYSESGGARDP